MPGHHNLDHYPGEYLAAGIAQDRKGRSFVPARWDRDKTRQDDLFESWVEL